MVSQMKLFKIYGREKFEYNTDPQRRCYNGCHFSSEWRWTNWGYLGAVDTEEEAKESVASWYKIGRKTCEYKYEYENSEVHYETDAQR